MRSSGTFNLNFPFREECIEVLNNIDVPKTPIVYGHHNVSCYLGKDLSVWIARYCRLLGFTFFCFVIFLFFLSLSVVTGQTSILMVS